MRAGFAFMLLLCAGTATRTTTMFQVANAAAVHRHLRVAVEASDQRRSRRRRVQPEEQGEGELTEYEDPHDAKHEDEARKAAATIVEHITKEYKVEGDESEQHLFLCPCLYSIYLTIRLTNDLLIIFAI